MARAQRGHQHRRVGGHQAQPTPARHQARALGPGKQLVVEPLQRGHVQPRARLGESAVADCAHQARLAQQRSEETVEHGLLRARAHRQQRGHQRRQRQLALAGERTGMVGVPRALGELRRGDVAVKSSSRHWIFVQYSGRHVERPCQEETLCKSTTYGLNSSRERLSSVDWAGRPRQAPLNSDVRPQNHCPWHSSNHQHS